MSPDFLLTQLLNGIQFGLLLFLMAAGLTLVFGIMSFINLAHGSLYMVGAYVAATTYVHTESFSLAVVASVAGLFVLALVLDRLAFAALQQRDHLQQVLATFGVVIFANEAVRMVFGNAPVYLDAPAALSQPVSILGFNYSAYRLMIIAAGLLVALALHLLIDRTRAGMLIRAGASNRKMVSALGVNIGWLNSFIFALGAALAGLAGAIAGPILSVQAGMGEPVLILTLVVIVIGGIGSVRGAFFGALTVGVIDTLGRGVMPTILNALLDPSIAGAVGPALASAGVYVLMAAVLAFKPDGLFPVRYT
ncbi:branched-chain amino acid ABC transporter permease [Variovorax paradoxus]|uniref:branched-chain amino acid ABC transporter permease n=1 Tax=Variovorax paradoxus TaxID=34073 RepID=UPI00278496A1|nr:branched-chain amino acid ABC transporter permease [Variovorax paradoxus]MDP9932794.1 branched-chain amino acid transport system permease protein [Variovorax paradoxus]